MAAESAVMRTPGILPRPAFVAVASVVSIAAVVATVLDQTRGLFSVLAAGGLVLAYFATGLLVERFAMQYPDATGMTITMASYAIRVALLGVVLWWGMSTPTVAGQLSSGWVAVGAVGALLAWTSGLMWWHSRSRIAVYDQPYEAPEGWDHEDRHTT